MYALGSRPAIWQAIARDLKASGVEVMGEPAVRYGAHGMGLSIYVRDPEGNIIELKQMPGDSRLSTNVSTFLSSSACFWSLPH